jgi:hypothetical protein
MTRKSSNQTHSNSQDDDGNNFFKEIEEGMVSNNTTE